MACPRCLCGARHDVTATVAQGRKRQRHTKHNAGFNAPSRFSSVVLPPPDLPRMSTNSPRLIDKDTPRRAGTPSVPQRRGRTTGVISVHLRPRSEPRQVNGTPTPSRYVLCTFRTSTTTSLSENASWSEGGGCSGHTYSSQVGGCQPFLAEEPQERTNAPTTSRRSAARKQTTPRQVSPHAMSTQSRLRWCPAASFPTTP